MMKKPRIQAGIVFGTGFVALYAGLYYRAMHPKRPKPDKTRKRIACVGDSITYGYGLMGAFRKYCYPNQLQDLLGASYQVMNFGICDRTLQDPLVVPGAHILSDERHRGLAEGYDREPVKVLDFEICRECRDRCVAVSVDEVLHYDIRQCDHDRLDPCRESDTEDVPQRA